MAHAKHAQVRQRYEFRCGYCGVSEIDAGSELTVDHYHPVTAGGDDSDDNLVYACFKCNQYKGDYWPDNEDRMRQWRVLHPLRDDVTAHVRLDEDTGRLEPRTETGRFHVALLQLNRPPLMQHRQHRRLAALLGAKQRLLQAKIARLRATLAEQERYIAFLRELLDLPPEDPEAE